MSRTRASAPAVRHYDGAERPRPARKRSLRRHMQKTQNLQDMFLNQARKDRLAVTMFLMNGFQLRGVIRGFDGFTVILDSDGKQQMIYKHAISTVVPVRPVPLEAAEGGF